MLLLIVVLGLCLVAGSAVMSTLLMAGGMTPEDLKNGLDGVDINIGIMRLGLGLSHVIIFVLSSLIFANLVQKESFGKYFV